MKKLFLLLFAFSAFAAEPGATTKEAPLSPAGQKRLLQNLEILRQNLKDTESNIETIGANVKSLESELGSLSQLEAEHASLKKKYQQFLAGAAKESEKNDQAMKDLDKFLKNAKEVLAKDPDNAKVRSQLEDAERDREARQTWKANTKAKNEKLQGLLAQLNHGADEIKNRRIQINGQMKSWQGRRAEYEALKKDIERRIRDTERQVATLAPAETRAPTTEKTN